jgi:hypothetical protein
MLTNSLIKNICNICLIKNNGKAHLFLQELLTVRIMLDIFRTFALFIDAIPLTIAAYKPVLTSRRHHWGWLKRQWTWGYTMSINEVVSKSMAGYSFAVSELPSRSHVAVFSECQNALWSVYFTATTRILRCGCFSKATTRSGRFLRSLSIFGLWA